MNSNFLVNNYSVVRQTHFLPCFSQKFCVCLAQTKNKKERQLNRSEVKSGNSKTFGKKWARVLLLFFALKSSSILHFCHLLHIFRFFFLRGLYWSRVDTNSPSDDASASVPRGGRIKSNEKEKIRGFRNGSSGNCPGRHSKTMGACAARSKLPE